MEADRRVISFETPDDKARGFYELIHSRASFTGVGKNKFIVAKKECDFLKTKNIKYRQIE